MKRENFRATARMGLTQARRSRCFLMHFTGKGVDLTMINAHAPTQLNEFIKHIKAVFPGSRVLSAEEAKSFKGISASYKSKLAKEKNLQRDLLV